MSALLEQIQSGAETIQSPLDVSELGSGNRKTPPGRWRATVTEAYVGLNKKGNDTNLHLTVRIDDGPATGATIRDTGPYPSCDVTDSNYGKRAFKVRQVIGSVASAQGGKAKVAEIMEKGAVNAKLTYSHEDKNLGKLYAVPMLQGKEVFVQTCMEPSRTDPNKEYSKVTAFLTVEEYEAAPGQEEDFSFTQKGNQAATAPMVNETVQGGNLVAPSNGTAPAAQAAAAADDLL